MTVLTSSTTAVGALRDGAAPTRRSVVDRSVAVRLTIAAFAVIVAYRTTLATLLESVQVDTPLAHLSLVPVISAALAYGHRRRDAGPDITDRQLDWIVATPLIGIALFMTLELPGELSWEFWVWRVDLLSLPFFVAGTVTLLFGVRTTWKYRTAIFFLFLAWPYPYAVALDRWLGTFTGLTIDGLRAALVPLPLAEQVPNSESLFEVLHDGSPIRMSVANACSGANGLVGFLLVGAAFMLVIEGTRKRKAAWLGAGALLVWCFNLVRILVIFWTAGRWGEAVAIDGFHPYVGLVVFNIAVVVMMLAMPRFGLRFRGGSGRGGGSSHASLPRASRISLPTRPAFAAVGVATAALSIGMVNVDLRDYDRVATSLGEPRLAGFAESLERPDGWSVRETDRYDWSQRFFGSDSEWIRYTYTDVSAIRDSNADGRSLESNLPITADVITTSNRGSLSSYGVEQCYSFHGHDISDVADVDLGSGLTGGILTWTNVKKDLSWITLYWHWPVVRGDSTLYERITLVMQSRPGATFDAPGIGDESGSVAEPVSARSEAALDRQRRFLTEFGRELVARRSTSP